ncbi:hypothetical protein D9M68_922270 [compost metagenome]
MKLKPYHLVIVFIVLMALVGPKFVGWLTAVLLFAAIVLWVFAIALGFPGWRSKPRP